MKKLQIDLSHLVNPEFYEFMNLIRSAANDANPTLNKFKPEYDVFDVIVIRLLAALNREQGSQQTKTLQQLDARRDVAITGFVNWIKGLADNPKPIKSEPAKVIQNYLNTQGTGIANLNWQIETAILNKIVTECNSQVNLKNAITTLDGQEWIDEIDQSNTAFETIYKNRTIEIGENGMKESFFAVRKLVIPAYDALLNMIWSRYTTAIADKTDITLLQKCTIEIETTIVQYRQLIKDTTANKKVTPPTPPKA